MSMYALTQGHGRRAGMRNPQRIAIVEHLEAAGECTAKQILEAMLERGVVTVQELEDNPYWLAQRLSHLHEGERVSRRTNDAGMLVWFVGAGPEAPAAQAGADVVDGPVLRLPRVAQPRRIDRMNGPVYQPQPTQPARAGAMEFRRFPSLMGGQRVDYRSGT